MIADQQTVREVAADGLAQLGASRRGEEAEGWAAEFVAALTVEAGELAPTAAALALRVVEREGTIVGLPSEAARIVAEAVAQRQERGKSGGAQ